MSRGARWTLGAAMLLIAAGFAAVPWMFAPVGPRPGRGMILMAILPALIAVACFSATMRPVAVRLVAGVVLVVCVSYVGWEVATLRSLDDLLPWGHDGPTSLHKSLLAFATFGLPAAYVTWTGSYPAWGPHAPAFGVVLEADH